MAEALSPATPSGAYTAALPMLDKVDAVLGGVECMRAGKEKYLPKLPNEQQTRYDRRVGNAPFTNIYRDVVEGLCGRLFREKIALKDDADQAFKDLAEDIDGQGNNLHVFAAHTGWKGINHGLSWILVDYTKAAPGKTIAEEKAAGSRPYWVLIPRRNMLAVYPGVVQGKVVPVHARISEPVLVREGYGEKTLNRIRILNRDPIFDPQNPEIIIDYAPATWELWQEGSTIGDRGKDIWTKIGSGPITIGVIPLAPYIAGQREGGAWDVRPPLKDAADKQIEHYQRGANLWSAEERTAFAVIAANGVEPDLDSAGNPKPLPVGPGDVLYAKPYQAGDGMAHGEFKFEEPQGSSLAHLSKELQECEKGLRELGKQPLTASSGNLTVVNSANAADKSISVCEAWGLNLKDALELAWLFTAMWLNQPDAAPEVVINLANLLLDLEGGEEFKDLLEMRKSGDLSQETLWHEAKRRGRLSPEFDPETEKAAIIAEMPEGGEEEVEQEPAAA